MIKIKPEFYTSFTLKEEKLKNRCRSIAVIKKKAKNANNQNSFANKASTMTRIYSSKILSPNVLSNATLDTISPKNPNLNKTTISMHKVQTAKMLKDSFVSAKSDILKKKAVDKNVQEYEQTKKHYTFPHKKSGECFDEPMIVYPILNSNKSHLSTDLSKSKPCSFLSSKFENISKNHSFNSQETLVIDFKLKVLHIFQTFKKNHLEITSKRS